MVLPVISSIFLVLFGCTANVVSLENSLALRASGCDYSPSLMTMIQFALVAAVSFPSQLRRNFRREIPFILHALTVALFFACSVLANLAYSYHISIPVHQMFRAGTLPATMLLNMLIFKKTFPVFKIVSVLAVSVGIYFVTLAEQKQVMANPSVAKSEVETREWFTGIVILMLVTIITALLSTLQEHSIDICARTPATPSPQNPSPSAPSSVATPTDAQKQETRRRVANEGLFYNHLLAIPLFFIRYDEMMMAVNTALEKQSCAQAVTWLQYSHSWWIFLALNAISQVVCIFGVYRLQALTSAVTTILVTTLRKFLSIVVSVMFFGSAFSLMHGVGSALVIFGSLFYSISPRDLFVRVHFTGTKRPEQIANSTLTPEANPKPTPKPKPTSPAARQRRSARSASPYIKLRN